MSNTSLEAVVAKPRLPFSLPQPQWGIGTELDLSRLNADVRNYLAARIRRETIQRHRRTLVASRRTQLGAKPGFDKSKETLKQGVLREFALMESPDKVLIAGARANSESEGYVVPRSFLDAHPSGGVDFSYSLMFLKNIDGTEYAYTYPEPLLVDMDVAACAVPD